MMRRYTTSLSLIQAQCGTPSSMILTSRPTQLQLFLPGPQPRRTCSLHSQHSPFDVHAGLSHDLPFRRSAPLRYLKPRRRMTWVTEDPFLAFVASEEAKDEQMSRGRKIVV
jgi:hypothetical protein